MIPHRARVLETDPAGARLVIEDTLADGVVVRHQIVAGKDEVDFQVVAHNPTTRPSDAHWAQPCIRVGPFAGFSDRSGDAYLPKCFIFLQGEPRPAAATSHWATTAPYTCARPGLVSERNQSGRRQPAAAERPGAR